MQAKTVITTTEGLQIINMGFSLSLKASGSFESYDLKTVSVSDLEGKSFIIQDTPTNGSCENSPLARVQCSGEVWIRLL